MTVRSCISTIFMHLLSERNGLQLCINSYNQEAGKFTISIFTVVKSILFPNFNSLCTSRYFVLYAIKNVLRISKITSNKNKLN